MVHRPGNMLLSSKIFKYISFGSIKMNTEYFLKKIGLLTFYIFIIFFVASCAARYDRYGLPQYGYDYQKPEQLDDGWATSSLDAEGVDSAKIKV